MRPQDTVLPALAQALIARGEWLAIAESCTGGLLSSWCTDLPGSSRWFERGVITYSNAAKNSLLGVPDAQIATHGAVSAEVASTMAEGLLARAPVQHAIALTGIAGPDGGSTEKPVGTVWLALAGGGVATHVERLQLDGDRAQVRQQAALWALVRILQRLSTPP